MDVQKKTKCSNKVKDQLDLSPHQQKLEGDFATEKTDRLTEHLDLSSEEPIKKDKGEWILGTSYSPQRSSTETSSNSQGRKTLNVYGNPVPTRILPFIKQRSLAKIHDRLHQNEEKIKNLQAKLEGLCSLLDSFLKLLHSEIVPHMVIEARANKKTVHLNPQQIFAITNALVKSASRNPSIKRILQGEDLSHIRCYKCNKLGHLARFCRNFGPRKGQQRPLYGHKHSTLPETC